MATAAVTIVPRLEVISFSLYWKEALTVDTKCLPEVELELELGGSDGAAADAALETTSAQALLERVAERMGWQPVGELHRLDGFTDPWERCIFKGREVKAEQALASAGVKAGDRVVVVRRVLKADGWAILQDGDFLCSEEEEEEQDESTAALMQLQGLRI